MRKRMLVACCVLSFAVTAAAQTIGTYALWPDTALDQSGIIFGTPPPDPARTYINLSPATSNATIRMVTFRVAGASVITPCTDAVKVKFFRRNGNVLAFLAQRGPFTTNGNITKVMLPTPVEVLTGDVIGITLVRNCPLGGYQLAPIAQVMKTEGTAFIQGDAVGNYAIYPSAGNTLPQARLLPTIALSVFGASTADAEVRSQVIVVSGAASGVGGSRFKTDIQMANLPSPLFVFSPPLRGDTVQGRLVYHPAGTPAAATDPATPFTLLAGQNRTFLDYVGSLGRSGIGSIDVFTTVGFEPPLATARIYEASAGSTKGLTIDAQILDRALTGEAVLFAPPDPTKFRMNIGVRTLDRPVRIGLQIYRANGTERSDAVTLNLPAHYFVQNEASQLLGKALVAGDVIVVITDAPAFVYGSITDNTSQDPSVQFASVLK